jgi:hypothetical protein
MLGTRTYTNPNDTEATAAGAKEARVFSANGMGEKKKARLL